MFLSETKYSKKFNLFNNAPLYFYSCSNKNSNTIRNNFQALLQDKRKSTGQINACSFIASKTISKKYSINKHNYT